MKRFAPAATVAILAFTLTAAAQNERYRDLGRTGPFAVLSTEATGPETTRKLTAVIASDAGAGPGGSDSFVLAMTVDCTGNTAQLLWIKAFAGDREISVADDPVEARAVRPDTPHALIYRYACSGKAAAGAPLWINGEAAARRHAIAAARG